MSASKPKSFAKAFEELETVAQWFEQGDPDVDEGLKKFERGLELAAFCKAKLAEVENKVKDIEAKFYERP